MKTSSVGNIIQTPNANLIRALIVLMLVTAVFSTARGSVQDHRNEARDAVPSITGTATVTGPDAVPTVNDSDGIGAGNDQYIFYSGDGSSSYGWPGMNLWVSFSDMWAANVKIINKGCIVKGIPQNSPNETQAIHDAIEFMANASAFDHRVILAIIMQETKGCVRSNTTYGTVDNPGLMQSYEGASCNNNYTLTDPCPLETIYTMVEDGVMGTKTGITAGLVQQMDNSTVQRLEPAQAFYWAARMYNSGYVAADRNLGSKASGATLCYASDVANRLTGWVTANSTCVL